MSQENRKNIIDVATAWPLPRKLSLLGVALVSLVVFAIIISQAQVADHRLLFANLANKDAASVLSWLKERKIPYQLEDGGKAIYIPADQVYESRLELAGLGLPQGSGVGFEVFDKQSFGLTDFAQRVNYLRALQGELSRTISSLAPVEQARVHLVLPNKRLYRDEQKEATASVILQFSMGRELKESQIQGIVHLVAGSVEGLEADMVTVVDANGRILTASHDEENAGLASPGILDYQQTLERRLENRAQTLLDRALGMENSVVRVSASLDFLQQEQTEEIYDPDASVVRSEQSVQEKSGMSSAGGVPGAQSNLQQGGVNAFAPVPTSRSEESVNYEISKVVSHKVFPVGTVKQLSVAVLVADRVTPSADGDVTYAPRSEKELVAIENMVRNALGLEKSRGDRIEVTSMPFEETFVNEPPPAPTAPDNLYTYLPFIKYGLVTLGLFFAYLLLFRPMIKTMKGETQVVSPLKTVEELENEMTGKKALPKPGVKPDPAEQMRSRALLEQGPFAQVIKGWLKEG